MASSGRPHQQQKTLDLELTVVSAKHLKNVNWRNGDPKPYAVFWLDPDSKLATKPDESGSTRPVWNERFTLPVPFPPHEAVLTLEVFHSKPSETPKPLVGSVRVPIRDLIDSVDSNISPLKALDLRRPSGRPQGKIRRKLVLRERPSSPSPPAADYHLNPPPSAYFYSGGIPPPPRDYRGYSAPYTTGLPPPPPVPAAPPSRYGYGNYSDPYPGGYYSAAYYLHSPSPPPPPRPYYSRVSGYGGPSAPVDFSSGSSYYEQKPKGSKMGLGAGLAVGALAGGLAGVALDEGLKYEEEKIAEKVEKDLAARDDYSDYRGDY